MRQTVLGRQPASTWVEVPMGSNVRLDVHLASLPTIKSRAHAQKLIEEGFVRLGGKRENKASRILRPTDCVEYQLPSAPSVLIEDGKDLDLEVLYEDDHCLVINKPAGVAVHAGSGMSKDDVTIVDGARFLFASRKIPFYPSEILVHRLDKETTGCLLLAKNPEAHQYLQKQFEDRTVQKTYLACVAGLPSPASAMIDAPIGRHTGDRTKMSIIQTSTTRMAKTTYRTLSTVPDIALLACDLHTGRTHQIRVHLRSIGHPILGDEKYETTFSLAVTARFQVDFLCLHAWKLSFLSVEGKPVSVIAPLQKNLANFLRTAGLRIPTVGT